VHARVCVCDMEWVIITICTSAGLTVCSRNLTMTGISSISAEDRACTADLWIYTSWTTKAPNPSSIFKQFKRPTSKNIRAVTIDAL